jgi:hypothetical protein
MKHCECCTKKAQLYDKLTIDLVLLGEYFQDIVAHSKGIGTNKSSAKKMCIEVIVDRGMDLVTNIVSNGKYKKYLGFCTHKDGEA